MTLEEEYFTQARGNEIKIPYVNATSLRINLGSAVVSSYSVCFGDGFVIVPINVLYLKTFSSPTSGILMIKQADTLNKFASVLSSAFFVCTLADFSPATGLRLLSIFGNITGFINNIGKNMLNFQSGGSSTIKGNIVDVNEDQTSFRAEGLYDEVYSTDANLAIFNSLQQLRLKGLCQHIGDLSLLPAPMVILSLKNQTTPIHRVNYLSERTFAPNMRIFEVLPELGYGVSTPGIDLLIKNLSQTNWINEKLVIINGNNARRSVASDEHYATLDALTTTLLVNEPLQYYVRPAGTTYGSGDGLSYANAFSGNAGIQANLSAIDGNRIAICGTHFEKLAFDGISAHLQFNDVNEAGLIDCADALSVGLEMKNMPYLYIENTNVIDATVSCIEFTNCVGKTKNTIVSGSGNQGLQNLLENTLEHENFIVFDCIDDGISSHENGQITLTGTGSFTNCGSGINIINTSQVTINGDYTFTGNSEDIWAANAATNESCVITANNCTFPNQVLASNGAKVVLNNCTANDVVLSSGALKGFLEVNNSVIESLTTANNIATINNCTVNNIATISATGIVEINDSYVKPVGVFDNNGTLRLLRTFWDSINCTDHSIDVNSGGVLSVINSVIYRPISGKFALSVRTGSTIEALENTNIIGVANVGRGIYTQVTFTAKNLIINDLDMATFVISGQTLTLENSCLFDNTTLNGSTGTLTEIDSQNTDPLFEDVALLDFNLQAGSSCISTGVTLTENVAIDSAVWSDEPPTITTANQPTNWNIGAYV
jgi:hypothetical protein